MSFSNCWTSLDRAQEKGSPKRRPGFSRPEIFFDLLHTYSRLLQGLKIRGVRSNTTVVGINSRTRNEFMRRGHRFSQNSNEDLMISALVSKKR